MVQPFTYAVGTFIGIGVLILPMLFQQAGIILGTAGLLFSALLLLFLAFIVMDLIRLAKKDLPGSVEQYLGWGRPLVRISLAVFTYGALVAYVVGAGSQMAALAGGMGAQYWGALFFVLAAIPVLQDSRTFGKLAVYLSVVLLLTLALLIPMNISASAFSPPAFGSWTVVPFLLSVSIFSLFGHTSIHRISRMCGKEQEMKAKFFGAFFLSLIIYLFYTTTSSSVGPMGDLSTVSLLFYYGPFIRTLITLVAVLAFYTSFVNISLDFVKPLEASRRMQSGAALSLLFFPTAVLYVLVHQFGIMTLAELVARFCGVGIVIFAMTACVAHSRASRKHKTAIPGWLSAVLAFVFVAVAAFNILPV